AAQAALSLKDMCVVVSGAGNVAEHTARLLLERGATVQTLSDRGGYLYKESGFRQADIDDVVKHKATGGALESLALPGATYRTDTPWQHVPADAYFPCATQNEVGETDALAMVKTAKLIVEGANMPLNDAAMNVVRDSSAVYVPGKAANAGGVAVSGLEMAQNASHLPWACDRVETELKTIMQLIHTQCVEYGTQDDGSVDYVAGANLAGFHRVFSAMEKLGW
ncbi:MAG TPA: glutamate dehydrogenase, partial [Candidatus Paceibacterota bacterium]|nr:glutamate dehydrogenase [Candidatus Paceibacterota bacterium]